LRPTQTFLTTVHYTAGYDGIACHGKAAKCHARQAFSRRAQAGAHAALYELPVRQAPICLLHPCWYTAAPQPKGSTRRGCRRLPLSSTCSERPVKRHDMLAGILARAAPLFHDSAAPGALHSRKARAVVQLPPCADCMPSRPSRAAMTTVPSSRSNDSGASRGACMSHTPR